MEGISGDCVDAFVAGGTKDAVESFRNVMLFKQPPVVQQTIDTKRERLANEYW